MRRLCLILFLMISSVYAEEFHCRITDVSDYKTKEKVSKSFLNKEGIVETDGETNMWHYGNGYHFGYTGSTSKSTEAHIRISKLDGKFFDMFLFSGNHKYRHPEGVIVSGFCKER